jgi:hypothetical protein
LVRTPVTPCHHSAQAMRTCWQQVPRTAGRVDWIQGDRSADGGGE